MLWATSSLKGTRFPICSWYSSRWLFILKNIKAISHKGSLSFRYYAAVDAKKERTSKHAQSFGSKNTSQNTTASQVTPLISPLSPQSSLYSLYKRPHAPRSRPSRTERCGSPSCTSCPCGSRRRWLRSPFPGRAATRTPARWTPWTWQPP